MAAHDFLQALAGEFLAFIELTRTAIADPVAGDATMRDMGLNPAARGERAPVELARLEFIKAYRDSPNPSREAGIGALADIAACLDVLASEAAVIADAAGGGGTGAVAEQIGHDFLQLATSNFVRIRYPRLFLILEAASTVEEITSTYGPGNNNGVNVLSSLFALLGYIWQPGKSLERLAGNTVTSPTVAAMEFAVRVAAIVLAALNKDGEVSYVEDVLTGWDGRGIDVDSPQDPFLSDVIAGRMTSIALSSNKKHAEPDDESPNRLLATIAFLHELEGGPALFLSLGGRASFERELDRTWTYELEAAAEPAASIAWGFEPGFVGAAPDNADDFEVTVSVSANPRKPTIEDPSPPPVALWFPSRTGSRIEVERLDIRLSVKAAGIEHRMTASNGLMVLDANDLDGVMGELLGDVPVRLPFNLVLGFSSSNGSIVEGSFGSSAPAPIGATGNGGRGRAIAIPGGRTIGKLTIHEVALRFGSGPVDAADGEDTKFRVEVDASFSTQIGPAYVRVDQLGVQFAVDTGKPPEESNLRLLDLDVGAKFPRGIAIDIKTDVVWGGGSLLHDPDQGLYFGILSLAFRGGLTMQAICLATTRNPDGSKGFSLVAILTFELARPWPLPMGFYLQGFGGLVTVHRTFDEVALRAALPTGQLRNVLFPADPVHHTTEILTSLQTLFPVRRGSVIVGLLAKIGWASPTLVQFEVALLYEFGRARLILLGRVSATFPRPDFAVIKLNMDAVGVLDRQAGTVALDAVLYDSKLCDRFVISGAMALRAAWAGSGGFALAIGGLHPKFAVPAGFPTVARLQLALTTGDNPKLICRAYFAVTSNTIQFGADASLYASKYGFSIEGEIGFDVLIQLLPLHFLAEFRASVQLKRGSTNLFKVTVSGELEGPLPLRVAGKATFEILWCDHSVSFNKTLVDDEAPNDIVPINVLAELVKAMSREQAWQATLPAGASQLVSVRVTPADGLLLHPLGSLTVRQTVVPLGLNEDIDRVGVARPTGDRRFAITGAAIGSLMLAKADVTDVTEMFAPAQYVDMTDDEKLAAPSFVPMGAGATFGGGAHTFGQAETSAFTYTDIVIGEDGEPVLEEDEEPPVIVPPNMLDLIRLGAVERSDVGRSLDRRYATPVRPSAPKLAAMGWAVVDPAVATADAPSGGAAASPGVAVVDTPLTWIEARGLARKAAKVVVPVAEVTR